MLRTPQQTPIAFLWDGQSEKLPLTERDLDLHVIYGSLRPHESSLQTAYWSVQPFLQCSRTWPTDRHTDHFTPSVAVGRI